MTETQTIIAPSTSTGPLQSPFLRAPESARSVIIVTLLAALAPLAGGIVFFGWRAAEIALLSVGGCVACEWAYSKASRMPAMRHRAHAVLTGVLLALTLPAWAPWYVPLVAALFATIIGKAIFGGVGHFLWQPALVGRLAVAVLFATPLTTPFENHPQAQPVLTPNHVIVGDIMQARRTRETQPWRETLLPPGSDAMLVRPPLTVLAPLTRDDSPEFSALLDVPVYQEPERDAWGETSAANGVPRVKPAALMKVPSIQDMLLGARPGGVGETCAVVIVVAGLYLIYRNYIKWVLPTAFVLSAAAVAALGPIQLVGEHHAVSWGWGPEAGWSWTALLDLRSWTAPPLLREGLWTGVLYMIYQILGGELLLAAFFLSNETTSRPVTSGGQVIFGLTGGTIAMALQMYTDLPIPAYMAVLVMNTFTPTIDALWRPRVFGRRRFAWLHRKDTAAQ